MLRTRFGILKVWCSFSYAVRVSTIKNIGIKEQAVLFDRPGYTFKFSRKCIFVGRKIKLILWAIKGTIS